MLERVNLQQAVCRLVRPAVGRFLVQPLQQLRFVRAELGERLMHRRTHNLQLLRLQCTQRAIGSGTFWLRLPSMHTVRSTLAQTLQYSAVRCSTRSMRSTESARATGKAQRQQRSCMLIAAQCCAVSHAARML